MNSGSGGLAADGATASLAAFVFGLGVSSAPGVPDSPTPVDVGAVEGLAVVCGSADGLAVADGFSISVQLPSGRGFAIPDDSKKAVACSASGESGLTPKALKNLSRVMAYWPLPDADRAAARTFWTEEYCSSDG
jgi:hypothetical protein